MAVEVFKTLDLDIKLDWCLLFVVKLLGENKYVCHKCMKCCSVSVSATLRHKS